MILKGTIYITHDINLCLSNLNMCKTIVIADEPDSLQYNIPGKIGGSLLLPPYEAMVHLVDDDMKAFNREYNIYLGTNYSVDKFISIIIQALIAGTNIIFLLDQEVNNEIEVALLNFFAAQYGIIIGTSSRSFAFDISYTPFILNKLYAEEDMPKETYLTLYPQDISFDQFTLQKLMYEYDISFNDLSTAHAYFKKQSIILKNGGLIQGVVKRPE